MRTDTPSNTSDFLEETIKSRPKNRRRFIKRMMEVILSAVLFGVVACVTMMFLSPVLEERLFPTPENEVEITFAEEPPNYTTEEIQPEDMLLEEEEPAAEVTEVVIDTEQQLLDMIRLLNQKAAEYNNWLVEVTGMSNEVSWLESTKVSANVTSGAIIADNGTQLLILTQQGCLEQAEQIWVTFADKTGADALVKGSDKEAGLMVLAVDKSQLTEATLQTCQAVSMSSSNNQSLVGSLVLALGASNGEIGSINYGIVSSIGTQVSDWDCNYKLIRTNMYSNHTPNGFLVNLKGELIGILCNEYNAEDSKNMLTALGISELKKKIERMSNGEEVPMLGVKGTEVTQSIQKMHEDIPKGAYVTAVQLDSAAMQSGIQAGDVIIKAGEKEISSMTALAYKLQQMNVGDKLELVIMRQSQGTYKESTVEITLGKQ